jgi:beta-lactamase regulating signal transducer with metallopeptidase domain
MNEFSHHWLSWVQAGTWQLALLVSIVGLACLVARTAPAALRHGLWLLVLAKVFLPPALWTPVSLGQWGVGPLLRAAPVSSIAPETSQQAAQLDGEDTTGGPAEAFAAPAAHEELTTATWLMIVWAAGFLVFWGIIGARYAWLARETRSAPALEEGPVRVLLEQIAIDFRVARVPELVTTTRATGPFLFGVLRPRIVLPQRLIDELDQPELRAVLTHELVHWKRRDTWIGWLQLAAQSLYWFHPFVWWANRQLRHERECACDETVLRMGRIAPESYGESIVRLLTLSRGRSLAAGSLVGVFERGSKLQERLEQIMSYKPAERRRGWASGLSLAVFAIVFLPMAPGAGDPHPVQAQDKGDTVPEKRKTAKTSYPQIVRTIPEPGATDVDPGLKEIRVTFDREMDDDGYSWTGGPPEFPPIDKSRQVGWIDARTCVLPVKLEKGSYYRVGINSTSHQNFRSRDGVSVPPSVLYFVTAGATESVAERVQVPEIVKLEPENGARDVDPATKTLSVTFNMPMGDGMSWTGSGPKFPTIPGGQKPRWSRDGRTCTLPVALEPDHEYGLGLNSLSHINFQSKWGVPLEPIVYQFRTRAAE